MTDQERLDKLIDLLTQIEPLMQGFPSVINRLNSLQENYDQQHKDGYHALEVLDMSASTGSKFLKQMKAMSRERRKNKLLLELAKDIQNIFNNKDVKVPQGVKMQIEQAVQRNNNKADSIRGMATANGKAFIDKAVNNGNIKLIKP